MTARAEERRLAREFGETFRKYRDGTPAFFPKFSLYRDAGDVTVYSRQALKVLLNVPSWILVSGSPRTVFVSHAHLQIAQRA